MQKPQLQTIFQAPFNENSWVEMLKSLFKVQHQRIVAEELTPGENEKGFYYGYSDVKDYKIGFFRYKIEKGSVVHRKSGLRNLVKIFTNQDWGSFDAAVVAFHDEKHWRLSFICDLRDEKTNPKRFTFLFGDENCSYRTAVDRFSTLQEKEINFQNLRDTFSVDMLTKEFYNELFAWYSWAIDLKTGVNFPNDKKDKNIKEDDREQIDTKIIRMITRIMFVWFIKQKNLVPNHLFDAAFLTTILKDFEPQNDKNGNFYNAILQNLFFATLNHDINERRFATNQQADIKSLYRYKELFADSLTEADVINLFAEIPFLNGGLFECLDKTVTMDGVVKSFYNDGFSRNARTNADGRPKYRAVVPNILFFEPEKGLFSILNRYNFTVEENTPTEQQVALDPELLGKVFENLLGAYNPETKETARNQSGSFYTPREIVNYMVDESLIAYLQTVVKSSTMCETAKNDFIRDLFSDDFRYDDLKWQEYQGIIGKLMTIKILDPACGSGAFPMGVLNRLVDILKKLDPNKTTYDVKLKLIENCIYGIDIQTIAMQISKLRFFISLICDAEKQAGAPNFGIPTLPNLETKFVCANSLISKKKRAAQGNLFENPRIEPVKEELIRIRHKHFNAKSASAKKNLRDDDTKLRTKLANLLKENDTFAPEDAQQFAQWNPYDQNACSPFFDSEWMFGVNDGFDIVIGNPPYVDYRKITNQTKIGLSSYQSYKERKTASLYVYFIELGLNLLRERGILCYINPCQYFTADSGYGIRKFIFQNYSLDRIIDCSNIRVFDNASTYTCINVITNIKQKKEIHYFKPETIDVLEVNSKMLDISKIISSREFQIIVSTNEIVEKIDKNKSVLSDFCDILCGLSLTGFRQFVSTKIENENYLPFVESKEIHRYSLIQKNYIDKSVFSKNAAKVFSEDEVLLMARMTKSIRVVLSPQGTTAGKVNVLYNFKHVKPLFLLGLLNSKLLTYYYYQKNESKHLSGGYLGFDIPSAQSIPIPLAASAQQQEIISLVEAILSAKRANPQADTAALEAEIDALVYKLYGLSAEEVKVVEGK